jgi:hypothetical protein
MPTNANCSIKERNKERPVKEYQRKDLKKKLTIFNEDKKLYKRDTRMAVAKQNGLF